MAALKAKGIKFSNSATEAKLQSLLEGETTEQPVEQPAVQPVVQPEQPNQLVEILTSISQKLEGMDKRLISLEQPKQPEVFSIGVKTVEPSPVKVEQTGDMFLTQVPVSLKKAAEDILGTKFTYECQAFPDRPAFSFTVVVPKEYTNVAEGQDRRTRVIDNALGANGVRNWCLLVKQNVIKYLGNNLTTVSL